MRIIRLQASVGLVRLARLVVLSSICTITFVLVSAGGAGAHEIRPAVADILVNAEDARIEIDLALESLLAGIDLQGLDDTDNAPEAAQYDALRAMAPAELQGVLKARWPELRGNFTLRAGTAQIVPELERVEIPEAGDTGLSRDSRLILLAALPPDDSPVQFGWAAANGPLILRQVEGGEDAYSALLEDGALSVPLPRQGYAAETAGGVFARFILQGFRHIIPLGADHIVFVLGLFFFSLHVRPLLVQITSFTLAHTVTLALAALGIVSIPASVVEPLIAASIVFVAVENVFWPKLSAWRTAVVFLFGLLHGLGFASVLGELGGGQANFLARLVGFNIGVELGQLAVIAAAFLGVGLWFGQRSWYRSAIAVPASVLIAAVGAFWFVERVLG